MRILFLFIPFLLFGCKLTPTIKSKLVGETQPSFKVRFLNSQDFTDTKELSPGKPFIVLYISTHCPFSGAQVKDITKNILDIKSVDIYILSVQSYSEIAEFSRKYNLDKYSNIKVAQDTSYTLYNYYHESKVPFIALYNKQRKLYKAKLGIVTANQISQAIESVD